MPVKKAVFSPYLIVKLFQCFWAFDLEQSQCQRSRQINLVPKLRAKRSTSMVKISKSKPVDENRASFSYANLSKGHRIDENRAPLDHVLSSMFQPAKSVRAESTRASDQIQTPAFTPMPPLSAPPLCLLGACRNDGSYAHARTSGQTPICSFDGNCSDFASVPTKRMPVAPSGCPMASEPPLTLFVNNIKFS